MRIAHLCNTFSALSETFIYNTVTELERQGEDAPRSFSAAPFTIQNSNTIADGARTPYLGRYTFPPVLEHADDMVTVSEDATRTAMRFLWERMKLVVEPTGALAVAAVLSEAVEVKGRRVGAIISGGNLERATVIIALRDVG